MKLSQAVSKAREIKVSFDSAELNVTYRPASYTTRELQQLQEDKDLRRVAQTIQRTLVTWDLEDEDGKPFPLEGEEALERLVDEVPISVFTEILKAVQEDQTPGEAGKTSAAG